MVVFKNNLHSSNFQSWNQQTAHLSYSYKYYSINITSSEWMIVVFPTRFCLIYSGPVVNKWTRCRQAINKMFTNISLMKLKTVLIDIMTMLKFIFAEDALCKLMNKFCWKQSSVTGYQFRTLFFTVQGSKPQKRELRLKQLLKSFRLRCSIAK